MTIFVRKQSSVGTFNFPRGQHNVADHLAIQLINAGVAYEVESPREAKKASKPKSSSKKSTPKKGEEPKADEPSKEDEADVDESEEGEESESGLSARAQKALEEIDLTLEEAKELSKDELTSFKGIGDQLADEILNA